MNIFNKLAATFVCKFVAIQGVGPRFFNCFLILRKWRALLLDIWLVIFNKKGEKKYFFKFGSHLHPK
jgi:hypothetical protein